LYYIFSTTPEEAIALFWAQIARARQDARADFSFRRALVALVELACLRGQTPPTTPEPSDQFRQESAEALQEFSGKIEAYSDITLFIAEDVREVSEWHEVCIRRSVIQVLWDDYAGTPVAALITPADVADLDGELRRVGAEYGPMPVEDVPAGLPAHHWWWRYPTPDADPTATAGRRRTEADAALLDEVAGVVQGLEHVAFRSPGAEIYNVREHQAEVPVRLQNPDDPVGAYVAAANDTIHTGRVVAAGRAASGSIRVRIHKDYGNDHVMEAIIYVNPDGTVTLATYGTATLRK
jgi:hypothetical protein